MTLQLIANRAMALVSERAPKDLRQRKLPQVQAGQQLQDGILST